MRLFLCTAFEADSSPFSSQLRKVDIFVFSSMHCDTVLLDNRDTWGDSCQSLIQYLLQISKGYTLMEFIIILVQMENVRFIITSSSSILQCVTQLTQPPTAESGPDVHT